MRFLGVLFTTLLISVFNTSAMADSVLMFSAEWCGYCQTAKKDMLENKQEVDTWNVEVVDADTAKDLMKDQRVKTLPTFLYLDDEGKELSRSVGYKGYRQLKRWIDINRNR